MTEQLFEKLLEKEESKTLDFKEEFYQFTEGADKARRDVEDSKFIKDIISFYNTIRDETAYIIIGIGVNADGTKKLQGLTVYFDNAKLQDKIKDKVKPVPYFEYSTFEFQGKKFGIITIPLPSFTKPSVPVRDFEGGGLKKDQIYFRRDSSNSDADGDEKEKIYEWLKKLSLQNNLLIANRKQLIKFIDKIFLYGKFDENTTETIYQKDDLIGINKKECDIIIEQRNSILTIIIIAYSFIGIFIVINSSC